MYEAEEGKMEAVSSGNGNIEDRTDKIVSGVDEYRELAGKLLDGEVKSVLDEEMRIAAQVRIEELYHLRGV